MPTTIELDWTLSRWVRGDLKFRALIFRRPRRLLDLGGSSVEVRGGVELGGSVSNRVVFRHKLGKNLQKTGFCDRARAPRRPRARRAAQRLRRPRAVRDPSGFAQIARVLPLDAQTMPTPA